MISLALLALSLVSPSSAHAELPAVTCFRDAVHTIGDQILARNLCFGAGSNAPLECWKGAYDLMGDAGLSVALCSGATEPDARVECVRQAYDGDYRQAVILCLGST